MAERLIGLATLLGLGLGLWQALGTGRDASAAGDQEAAAIVNGQAISRAEWQRAIEAIAADKRQPLSAADRQRALDNLISEELLVQQARLIGLLESDRGVRKAVVDAMLQFIRGAAESRPPSEDELRELYREERQLGHRETQLRLAHVTLDDGAAAAREALAAGADFQQVFATQLASSPLPGGWLLPSRLDSYLPPALIRQLDSLQAGEIAGPFTLGGKQHFVWLQDRKPASRASFAELRPQLAEFWRRRQAERAVEDYLNTLRASATIKQPAD